MAEYLAAAIVARHFPHLLDAPDAGGPPVVWLEHYPPGRGAPGEYDRVTFTPWRIRAAWLGGTLRWALGTPAWARLDRVGVVRWPDDSAGIVGCRVPSPPLPPGPPLGAPAERGR